MKTETGLPPKPGYYVVWMPFCTRPQVLWFAKDEWRSGCLKVSVEAWIGPLPERKQ